MDHLKVLRRTWEITWRCRSLWIFGIIIALTAGGGGGSGSGVQYNLRGEDFAPWSGRFPIARLPPNVGGALIAVGVGLACVIVILAIAAVVARYMAQTALIGMVDGYERTDEKQTVRQGFRLGWSRTSVRLFLIDLLIGLPVAVAFILLFLLALAPLLLWTTGSRVAGVMGTVATVGLVVLLTLLAIVVGVVLSLLTHFFRRACALEELGVIESLRQGYGIVRRHLKDVAIMWLIMVGLSFGWLLVMIPVTILLLALGAVLGGLPALLMGRLASVVFEGAVPWIVAGAVGIPIFILVVAVPGLFLGGLAQVFMSSAWTLTYGELRALEGVGLEVAPLPESDTPGLE